MNAKLEAHKLCTRDPIIGPGLQTKWPITIRNITRRWELREESFKPQAPSLKPMKAPICKLQALTSKLQAPSPKLQAPWSVNHGTFDNDPRLGDQGPGPRYNCCLDVAHAMQFGVMKIEFFYPSLLSVQLWKTCQNYYSPIDQACQEG